MPNSIQLSKGVDGSKDKTVTTNESHRSVETSSPYVLTKEKSVLSPDMLIISKGASVNKNQPDGQNWLSQIAYMVASDNRHGEVRGSYTAFPLMSDWQKWADQVRQAHYVLDIELVHTRSYVKGGHQH